jgi:hypothetical protein
MYCVTVHTEQVVVSVFLWAAPDAGRATAGIARTTDLMLAQGET